MDELNLICGFVLLAIILGGCLCIISGLPSAPQFFNPATVFAGLLIVALAVLWGYRGG